MLVPSLPLSCLTVIISGVVVEIYFTVGPTKAFFTERTFFFSNSSSWNCPEKSTYHNYQQYSKSISIPHYEYVLSDFKFSISVNLASLKRSSCVIW